MTGVQRVWLLIGGCAVAAILLYTTTVEGLRPPIDDVGLPWWVLAVGFYLAEIFVVELRFQHNPYSFSLSEIPLVIGLFFVDPLGAVAAQMLGAGLGLLIHRRQSVIKATFNVVTFGFEILVATWLFHQLLGSGADPLGPPGWIATFVSVSAWGFLQYLIIGVAVSLTNGRLRMDTVLDGIDTGIGITAANTGLALTAVTVIAMKPAAAWLICVPVAAMYFAYRAYTNERRKHESLEALYAASRSAHRSLETQEAMRNLLSQSLKIFAAQTASITLFPSNGSDAFLSTTLDSTGRFTYMTPDLNAREGTWARVAAEDRVLLVVKSTTNAKRRAHYERTGIREEIVAPLHRGPEVSGVMSLCNPMSEVNGFTEEDAKMLETLAGHASVSLENARLVAELHESLEHLTETNQLKDDFVASVSHELRTPLTSIRGYAKTLLRRDANFGPDDVRSFLETIDRQSERLHRLIEDLLVVSRIESSSPDDQVSEQISLRDVIDDVINELRAKLHGRDVTITLAESLPVVATDGGKVHQILCNLVDNAVKYSPSGAPIEIEAHRQGAGVTITVRDSGPGIDEKAQEKIFDRFYQVDQTATRSVGGAGLGLYICRKLAEALGGRLWLESSSRAGSEFNLWIPSNAARALDLESELKSTAQLDRLTNLS